MRKIPEQWTCPESIHEQWPSLEKRMLPLIVAKAKHVNHWLSMTYVDFDDAIQEGRLILLNALILYDDSKNASLDTFVSICLQKEYNTMLNKLLAKKRIPQGFVFENGEWVETRYPPLSMEDISLACIDENTPEECVSNIEMDEQARVFKMKLLMSLKKKHKMVFECIVNPSILFLKMIQNIGGDIENPTYENIAEYLGVTRETVKYSISKIKIEFTHMARKEEFEDLFGNISSGRDWPMIHISRNKGHDLKFVQKILKDRKLNPVPNKDCYNNKDFYKKSQSERYERMIERYSWGVVLILRRDKEWCTVVIEGEFNPAKGIVISKTGARKKLSIGWYEELLRGLEGE